MVDSTDLLPAQASRESIASLPDMLRAFNRATGWSLRYVPGLPGENSAKTPHDGSLSPELSWSILVDPGTGAAPGQLRLEPGPKSVPQPAASSDPQVAREFASALSGMLGELLRTRHALWLREAELAACVPLIPHADEARQQAIQLEAILRGGAQAADCNAAALYLLDESTSHLKLRSAWGLPADRLTNPPRPLATALADLEAMLGHAVVLEDGDLAGYWNPPEELSACVCVPVSSATSILGTLWLFSDQPRKFSSRQIQVIELVAGRLAADLERRVALQEALDGADLKRQFAAAEQLQRSQLPATPPLLDGWDIAGQTLQPRGPHGDFYDWLGLPDGQIAVALGHASGEGFPATLIANTVRTALRCHAPRTDAPSTLLRRVNRTLWTGSAGDQFADLFCAYLKPNSPRVRFSNAGNLHVLQVRPDGPRSLVEPTVLLGETADPRSREFELSFPRDSWLCIMTACHPQRTASLAPHLHKALSALPAPSPHPARVLATQVSEHLRAAQREGYRSLEGCVMILKRAAT